MLINVFLRIFLRILQLYLMCNIPKKTKAVTFQNTKSPSALPSSYFPCFSMFENCLTDNCFFPICRKSLTNNIHIHPKKPFAFQIMNKFSYLLKTNI